MLHLGTAQLVIGDPCRTPSLTDHEDGRDVPDISLRDDFIVMSNFVAFSERETPVFFIRYSQNLYIFDEFK